MAGSKADPDTNDAFDRMVASSRDSEGFDNPIPLPGDAAPPPFPIERLPGELRRIVLATSEALSVPVDLAAVTALGVVSTALVGGVDIELRPGWKESPNLYLVCVARSGEGKSPMMRKLTAPLNEIERDRQETARPKLADAATKRALLEKTLTKAISAGKDDEAYAIGQELAELPISAPPRLLARDATPEALVRLLWENKGRLGVVSDEGGEVFEMASRYVTNGKANIGLYLSGHDGDRYTEDRNSREPRTIERTTLTMVLAVQPIVVDEILSNPRMNGRGLPARYLWTYPESRVGHRPVDTSPIPDEVSAAWHELVHHVAEQAHRNEEPTTVTLTNDAADLFAEWREHHEARLAEGSGDLAGIAEWGNKLPAQAGRIALVLHVAESGQLGGSLQPHTMSAALCIADYFAAHALITFGRAKLDESAKDARRVLAWLRGQASTAPDTITTREATRARFETSTAEVARAALEVLGDRGWVKRLGSESVGPGRPSEKWKVNPLVYSSEDGMTEMTKPADRESSVISVMDSREGESSHASQPDPVFPRFDSPKEAAW